MNKKVDWGATYKPFGTQTVGGNTPKYRSGKEYFEKAQENQLLQEKAQKDFNKALPALEALLKCRLEAKAPITVVRPFSYQTSELVHKYAQVEDTENGGWKNGAIEYSNFQDVEKSIKVGTELTLQSLDPQMNEFIFKDQSNNEVILPYTSKQNLMISTNIYESVIAFMNKGE